MKNFDIVFTKLAEAAGEEADQMPEIDVKELDEIEELRRFSSEIQDTDPVSFTTTSGLG